MPRGHVPFQEGQDVVEVGGGRHLQEPLEVGSMKSGPQAERR